VLEQKHVDVLEEHLPYELNMLDEALGLRRISKGPAIWLAARAPYLPLRRPGPHSVRFTKMLAPSQPRRRSEFRTKH
jgi:hypothetical protein